MKVAFLIHNIYGVGGTNRTVLNLAVELSKRHTVEIASVFRWQEHTSFEVPRNVEIVPLLDGRPGRPDRTNVLRKQPSALFTADEEFYRLYSRLTDERIVQYLERTDADVVVGTRPGLNLLVARFAPDHAVKIAQEHMTHEMVAAGVREEMNVVYPRLDASVTVTAADAEHFRVTTPIPGLRLLAIPNSVPASSHAPSDCTSKLVVAAGRLSEVKRYDLLVKAFAKVVADRPDWKLRIYGSGAERSSLISLIVELRLFNNITLMGGQADLAEEWIKGSVGVVTSDKESFGMTIVEAMRSGLPVVSTACPAGPPEIINSGVDGLLVPVGDVDAIAAGLLELINDDDRRRSLGRAAFNSSRRYDPAQIAGTYERLFLELAAAKGAAVTPASTSAAAKKAVPGAGVLAWPGASSAVRRALTKRAKRVGRSLAKKSVRKMAQVLRLRRAVRFGRRFLRSRPHLREYLRVAVLGLGLRSETLAMRAKMRSFVAAQPLPPNGLSANSYVRQDGAVVIALKKSVRPGTSLLCMPRAAAKAGRGVRVPFLKGQAEAVVPLQFGLLPEGRLDLFVEHGGSRERLRAGLTDSRSLVEPRPEPQSTTVVQNVPYRTSDGYLAIRSWSRSRHAELEAIRYGEDVLTVEGHILGKVFGPTAPTLVLTHRTFPGLTIEVAAAVSDKSTFCFDIPLRHLVQKRRDRHDNWDLSIINGEDRDSVRIGRILDDVLERKSVYIYPGVRMNDDYPEFIDETPQTQVWVKPFLTDNSDLALLVSDE